jgi:hypothetical protein
VDIALVGLLPAYSVPLSTQGLEELLAQARADPAIAERACKELQDDPRRTILVLFDLTPVQRQAIEAATMAALRARVAPVIEAIKAGQLADWEYNPHHGPAPGCVIVVGAGPQTGNRPPMGPFRRMY